MRGGVRGAASFAAVVALAVLLGGCELLFGPVLPDDFSDPPSSPIASYTHGSATIAIKGGETIVLDELSTGATVDSAFGSDVAWSGPRGWHLRVSGAGASDTFGASFGGYVVLDRIVDGEHWTSLDGRDRCEVKIDVVSAATLRGAATCTGVVWYDALDMPVSADDPKPIGQPPFDAEVTFEATR